MKKLIILLGVLTVSLTSCLKDKPNVDFSNIGAFAEIVHAGKPYFGEASITDATDTITRTYQVNITGVNAPSKDVSVVVAVDNTIIAPYNAANTAVTYLQMPVGSFAMGATTATIKAGTRLANFTVTFYKSKLDPSKSYMFPIKIVSANGVALSGNYNIKYYHFIGNDFAGTYQHQFTRTPAAGNYTYAAGNTSSFLPNSPTEFEVMGGYYTGKVRYVVDFQKSAAGTYSHFSVKIDADDKANILDAIGAAITVAPTIPNYVEKEYSFSEALTMFDQQGFQYDILGGSGARHNYDQYRK